MMMKICKFLKLCLKKQNINKQSAQTFIEQIAYILKNQSKLDKKLRLPRKVNQIQSIKLNEQQIKIIRIIQPQRSSSCHKMSHLGLNRRRNSVKGTMQRRMITESLANEEDKENFNIDENIEENLNSIKDTLAMLKEYQQLCIQKQDFLMAEQTKNRIQFLQKQQKTIKKQRGILKQQQNIQTICKQGQQQVQNFQSYWDQTIKNLIDELKDIEGNFVNQQQLELSEYREKVTSDEGPKVKYTVKVLELRKNLTNLIKMRKYKEADEAKTKLRTLEAQCEQNWATKNDQRVKTLIQKFQKKQTSQLKALRAKLQTVFNQKIKQRDQKFQILLKRNRKRRIQSSKSKLKSLKESKYSQYSQSKSQSRVTLDNSKMSSFNCSTRC